MARSDTPNLSARPVRAEVPPANYWQRWSVANAAPGRIITWERIRGVPAGGRRTIEPTPGQPAAAMLRV